jgi:hypothetical protein
VVVLTGEKEDGNAWVRNWLRDGEIGRSGWPNGHKFSFGKMV